MKNAKNTIKFILMSVATLFVGFIAIALPFRIFDVGVDAARYLFIAEITIYFVLSIIYLFAKQKKAERKRKEQEKRIIRREKFQKAQEEYYNLAA